MNGNIKSAAPLIKNSENDEKIYGIINALEDIISTFRTEGSHEAKRLLFKVLARNRLEGGSPLQAGYARREGVEV